MELHGLFDFFRTAPSQKGSGNEIKNVLALVKGSERYVFLYDDESSGVLLKQLGRFATDSELNFTWYDAAVLSQKVRRMKQERRQEMNPDRLRRPADIN